MLNCFLFGIGGVNVEILRTVINILFILDCIALTVIVLMQEGKSAGLGAIAGAKRYLLGERTKAVLWKEHL